MPRDLLLGCGSSRDCRFSVEGRSTWGELVTLDNVASHKPDVLFDLSGIGDMGPLSWTNLPTGSTLRDLQGPVCLPFPDDEFDRVDCYECLEHIGKQGDYQKLFAQFTEFWRVLKPGGHFCATVPWWQSEWAWGDPSHTRVITPGTLVFLNQAEYTRQIGKTAMSDFRHIYQADFEPVFATHEGESFKFVLQAIKPSRISV